MNASTKTWMKLPRSLVALFPSSDITASCGKASFETEFETLI
jgi:hypothetical protein